MVAAALLSASIALAGCSTAGAGNAGGGSGGSGGSSGSLTIVSSTTAPEQAVIKAFNTKYPNIKVQTAEAPAATYSQVVATQLGGGSAADIIRAYPGNGSNLSVVQSSKRGFYADLSGLDFANKVPSSLRSVLTSDNGKLVVVPVTTSAIGGVYNKTVLDQIGVKIPTTWSEVLQYCSSVKAAHKVPYGLGLKDSWTGQFVSYALAATLVPSDFARQQQSGKATFANSKWKDVFTKYMQMKDAGCFTPQPNGTSYANVQDAMAQGTTAGSITLSSTIGDIAKSAPSGTDLEFDAFPATNNASQTKLSNGIGVVFALNAKSKHAADAKNLLDFFATPEAQALYSKAASTSPALDAGSAFKGDRASETISKYTQENNTAAWPDQTWPNPNVQQVHFDGVQGLFTGSGSIQDVLNKMDKAYKG